MLSLYISALLIGQAPLWARTIGGPGEEEFSNVISTPDGGLAGVGWTNSFGQGGADVMVVKMDRYGNIQWARTYGGEGSDIGCHISLTSDGGYVVTGMTTSYQADTDLLLLKIEPNGDLSWARIYRGLSPDVGCWAIQTYDGGYAVTGWTKSFGAGYCDHIVLRLDAGAGVVWARTFGRWGGDMAYTVVQTPDSGFIVAGFVYDFGLGMHDGIVYKLSSGGQMLWARLYGGQAGGNDGRLHALLTPDGGVVVTGEIYGVFGNFDVPLYKILPNGNLEWARAIGSSGEDRGDIAIPTADGGYAVVWWYLSGGIYLPRLSKFSSGGNLEWTRTIGLSDTWTRCITQTSDECYASAGGTRGIGAGASDIFVFKIASDGSYENCSAEYAPSSTNSPPLLTAPVTTSPLSCSPSVSTISLSTGIPDLTVMNVCEPVYEDVEEGQTYHSEITCFPVPGGLVFGSDFETGLKLYGADGRLVHSGLIAAGQNRVNLGQAGVYLWQAGPYKGKAVAR